MRTPSRFIPGEEINAVAQWDFAAVDTHSLRAAAQAQVYQQARDMERDEALRQEGYAQGFIQGQAHAVLDAEKKIADYVDHQGREAAERLAGLFSSADEQLSQAQQVLARGVLDLACELARQVLRQELSVNPNVLQPVVREALALLAADSKAAVVRLNPLDLEVLQEPLKAEFASLALTLVADASLQPGACLVTSGGTVVDGTLDMRWRRAVANLGLDMDWEDAAC